MSADFWAGYLSGAIGIIIGNPLDLLKTRIQAGSLRSIPAPPLNAPSDAQRTPLSHWTSLLRGAAAPILGYGALNALLFVTYNRSLALLSSSAAGSDGSTSAHPSLGAIWTAGAIGGLATFVVSAPTELVKCRAQVSSPPKSSLLVARELWSRGGVRGMYLGGGITSVRDAVGYGFYFWSYELSKRYMHSAFPVNKNQTQEAVNVLLCGGLAGVVTWATIFPLDVIKTRLQTHDLVPHPTLNTSRQPLLQPPSEPIKPATPSALSIARTAYANEGIGVFFRGLGVCSARAFVVNAVQWAVYEWTMARVFGIKASPVSG
ncbi:hypothetical protein B0A48_14498 [Cryoendolithus antarcticus]|uniref:Mitochondrial basic amino acids transporter n=1 Tax=Cryoendolithus antarcticus TaxID=1507870 RepID=A0A1V8SKS5_9PEZI|nr:hypothetical protein B0A48_14498 [Cryoendolithus antarcticus]